MTNDEISKDSMNTVSFTIIPVLMRIGINNLLTI
jgi:hypothetical protein